MSQTNSAPTQQATTTEEADATLLELDSELVRQNAELARALEWLREQGDRALPLDDELLEQVAELDRFAVATRATSLPRLPDHSTRC